MNYRHAYHAGNHTGVFKHSVLCQLLAELHNKPTPFAVLDTHAGAGQYNLKAPEARKTGEAQNGIGIILNKKLPSASIYLRIVRGRNPAGLSSYPGSPAIIQAFLRENDKLIACELHQVDSESLRATFRADRRISIHNRDGYEAIGAFVPLATKRGLVFIDPSFEQDDEFDRLAEARNAGVKKWPTGIFTAWYPLRDRSGVVTLRRHFRPASTPTLCCQFLRHPLDGLTLAGSALVICNPPWRIEVKIRALCRELASAFNGPGAGWGITWWVPER
jgi:23S rRNA (adenine2030-N6)-methyltransferase